MITRPPPFTTTLVSSFLRPSPSITQSYVCRPCQRSLHRGVPQDGRVPSPTPFVPDIPTFFSLIGREMSKHASKLQTWDELFTLTSLQLKERGFEPPRTRRYLLRWREKFRRGEFGIGGDFKYIKDGVSELRVVEVPAFPKDLKPDQLATVTKTPGLQKIIVNVPNGSDTYVLEAGQTTADLKKAQGFKLKNGYIITGPSAHPLKGTNGSGATLVAREGLWEHKRGHKIHGGERRRAETLHKLRVEENKKNSR
ncbi:hypothetical protein PV10_02040 [Exophiala mesophila]|uniref:Small ribosomal subunit protein mS41 n=1 Tax=Exophiala mesophila TaxID=212818 RepID=A0A0D1ZI04_EXOME|nr:uncharacterized protein PV10_02040 [Exophiala mesophila]KIV94257.1 hypothetical protein PV10_02040 [Exophiala mesophila]